MQILPHWRMKQSLSNCDRSVRHKSLTLIECERMARGLELHPWPHGILAHMELGLQTVRARIAWDFAAYPTQEMLTGFARGVGEQCGESRIRFGTYRDPNAPDDALVDIVDRNLE
jgi:hypothetical protein